MYSTQRGNILFLILLAVVLFAALSYAVTNNERGQIKSASTESVQAQLANILQFFTQIDSAVTRMTLTGGLTIENISFIYTRKQINGGALVSFDNTDCITDTCRLFKPAGGGISARIFETYGVDPGLGATDVVPGSFDFLMAQWPYAKTSLNDIVIRINNIDPLICAAVVSALNLPAPSTITISGPLLAIIPVSGWDGTGRTISPPQAILGKDVFAVGPTVRGPNQACSLWHLVYAR